MKEILLPAIIFDEPKALFGAYRSDLSRQCRLLSLVGFRLLLVYGCYDSPNALKFNSFEEVS
jgi:hypothetical protein